MALELPENAVVMCKIEIARVLKADGDTGTVYGFEDMQSGPDAIGLLSTVLDREREVERLSWDTCPGCGEPWEAHEDFE